MGQSNIVIPKSGVNDFGSQLAYSQAMGDYPFWNTVYKKAFPDMVNSMTCEIDCIAQRQGIDRILLLKNGQVLRVDEKKRTVDYQDILLEYISNDVMNTPGWMEKELQIDYLAYAFMPSKRVYLFPWLLLRRSWLHYKEEWIKKYPKIEAPNHSYTTICVAIPIEILLDTVKSAMIIQI